jgi:hypothetical protein
MQADYATRTFSLILQKNKSVLNLAILPEFGTYFSYNLPFALRSFQISPNF